MAADGISHLELVNFTAFSHLSMDFSPGINVLVGANSTGKTHVLKVLYDMAVSGSRSDGVGTALLRDFLPYQSRFAGLLHRGAETATIKLDCGGRAWPWNIAEAGSNGPSYGPGLAGVLIPAQEILSHAPGFRSLYSLREVQFEQLYADLLDRALLPLLREPLDDWRRSLLASLEAILGGQVRTRDETFFLATKDGETEFTLLAEGLRKLGLLWQLVRNGTLGEDTVLLWDEPEANLNPQMLGEVVAALLALQQAGTQVFVATHSYVLLKEFDLRAGPDHQVRYHAFRRNDANEVECSSTAEVALISPNAILDAYGSLLDRQLAWPTEGVIS